MPKVKEKKKDTPKEVTAIGYISYPHLAEPDTGGENASNKYSADLLISEKDFKDECEGLIKATARVGRAFYNDPTLKLSDFKNPIVKTDNMSPEELQYIPEKCRKGFVRIRARSEYRPLVCDKNKREFDTDEIREIKGGDRCRLIVSIFSYPQQGGGVSYGLNAVVFIRHDEPFGQGRSGLLKLLDNIEVDGGEESDDQDVLSTADENLEGEELPKKRGRPAGKGRKDREPVEDEEESIEDDLEDPEEEVKPKRKTQSKVKEVIEDEDDDF